MLPLPCRISQIRIMTLVLNPKYEYLRSFAQYIDLHFSQGGRTIHTGRNCLKVFQLEGIELCVKQYGNGPLRKRLMPNLHRMPKGKKACMRPLQLREQGFDSPEPVAYVAYRRSLLRNERYFICLKSHFSHTLMEGVKFEDTEKESLCEAFAKYIARLHDKGFLPVDLNATDDGRDQFALIDTNSIKRKRKIDTKSGVKNLMQFFPGGCNYKSLLAVYAEARGLNLDACETVLEAN